MSKFEMLIAKNVLSFRLARDEPLDFLPFFLSILRFGQFLSNSAAKFTKIIAFYETCKGQSFMVAIFQ